MATAKLSFNFPGEISGGTGPYKTSIDLESPLAGDFGDILTAVSAWWEASATFRGYLSSAMGAPLLTLGGEFGGIAVEDSLQTASAPTGGAPDLPGASIRAIKLGSRPAGGRRGSMFWPGVSGTATQATGALDATPRTNIGLALNDLRDDIEAAVAGAYLKQLHVVDGSPSETAVTDFSIAPTISWLQRRYR